MRNIRKLLKNTAIVKHMSCRHGDVLSEFEKVAEAADLGESPSTEASAAEQLSQQSA